MAGVEKGFNDLNLRMNTYEKTIDEFLEKTTLKRTNPKSGEWKEVIKKSKNYKKQPVAEAVPTPKLVGEKKRIKKQNPAIVVDSKPEDFPTLVKRLSKEVDQQTIGN